MKVKRRLTLKGFFRSKGFIAIVILFTLAIAGVIMITGVAPGKVYFNEKGIQLLDKFVEGASAEDTFMATVKEDGGVNIKAYKADGTILDVGDFSKVKKKALLKYTTRVGFKPHLAKDEYKNEIIVKDSNLQLFGNNLFDYCAEDVDNQTVAYWYQEDTNSTNDLKYKVCRIKNGGEEENLMNISKDKIKILDTIASNYLLDFTKDN